MGLVSYRARKQFNWDGWIYAPVGACKCVCAEHDESGCTGVVGSGCACGKDQTHCPCAIPENRYAGEVWLVLEGHPRLEAMMSARFAVADPSLAPAEELKEKPEYERLLHMWKPPVYESQRRQRSRVADPVA